MKDSLDRELHVGDQIVYCTRVSSSMDLIHARVLEAEDARVRVQPLNANRSNPVYLRTPYYIAKLEPLVEQDTFLWVEKNS